MDTGSFIEFAKERFIDKWFLTSLKLCSEFCELPVQSISHSKMEAGQQHCNLSYIEFKNFLKALESGNLDCLSRYAFRKAVYETMEIVYRNDPREGSQAATNFAEEFSEFFPAQKLRNCNLLSLVKGKGEEAVELLNTLGAFREPNDITVILFLAELDEQDFNKYRELYKLLPEFDRKIDQAGVHAWLTDNVDRVFDSIDLQALLCYAAENGQRGLVTHILKKLETGGRVDYRLAFSYAFLSEQREIVELFVEKQLTDLNQPIFWPRGEYHNNVINDMQGGHDASRQMPQNITPLAHAALTGKIDTVKYLLSKGLNPNHRGDSTHSPIGLATDNEDKECLRLLLSSEALTMGPCDPDNSTPLHIAACNLTDKEDVNIMDSLLQRGADINAKDASDQTPLIQASMCDNLSAVVFLMANNALTLPTDKFEDRNALHWASPEIANVLGKERRLLYTTDKDGETALTLQAHVRGGIRTLLPLYDQEREADLSRAFWSAIMGGCPDDAKFLLDYLSKEKDCKFLTRNKTWNEFVRCAKRGCFYYNYNSPDLRYATDIQNAIQRRLETMGTDDAEKLDKRMDELLRLNMTGNEEEDDILRDAVDTARKISKMASKVLQLFDDNVRDSKQVLGQKNFYLRFYNTIIAIALIWFYCYPARLKACSLYVVFTSLASYFLEDRS